MVILFECLILCLLFTIIVIPPAIKNPIGALYNYPPKIQERVKSIEVYKDKIPTNKKKRGKKIAALIVALLLISVVTYWNGARTFLQGFLYAYIMWLAVEWYDAIFLDCIFFCHSTKVRIAGTEDMIDEYHNYWFHIKGSIKGSLLGIAVCVPVGLIIFLIAVI